MNNKRKHFKMACLASVAVLLGACSSTPDVKTPASENIQTSGKQMSAISASAVSPVLTKTIDAVVPTTIATRKAVAPIIAKKVVVPPKIAVQKPAPKRNYAAAKPKYTAPKARYVAPKKRYVAPKKRYTPPKPIVVAAAKPAPRRVVRKAVRQPVRIAQRPVVTRPTANRNVASYQQPTRKTYTENPGLRRPSLPRASAAVVAGKPVYQPAAVPLRRPKKPVYVAPKPNTQRVAYNQQQARIQQAKEQAQRVKVAQQRQIREQAQRAYQAQLQLREQAQRAQQAQQQQARLQWQKDQKAMTYRVKWERDQQEKAQQQDLKMRQAKWQQAQARQQQLKAQQEQVWQQQARAQQEQARQEQVRAQQAQARQQQLIAQQSQARQQQLKAQQAQARQQQIRAQQAQVQLARQQRSARVQQVSYQPRVNNAVLRRPANTYSQSRIKGDFAGNSRAAAFVRMMASRHGFDASYVAGVLSRAEATPWLRKQAYKDANPVKRKKKTNVGPSWSNYRGRFITPRHINGGTAFYNRYRGTLQRAAAQYGVPEEYILGIMGVETIFGGNVGSDRAIDALSTMGFMNARRGNYFTSELESYFLMTRNARLDPLQPKASWAGALGLPQFMPSNIKKYGVDYDGDGAVNLWTPHDAIGSIANYLRSHGWRPGEIAAIPAVKTGGRGYTRLKNGFKHKHSLAKLARNGLRPSYPGVSGNVNMVKLRTRRGNEYWVGGNNFYVITRYNHSSHYAMAVHQLAQEIRKRVKPGGRSNMPRVIEASADQDLLRAAANTLL